MPSNLFILLLPTLIVVVAILVWANAKQPRLTIRTLRRFAAGLPLALKKSLFGRSDRRLIGRKENQARFRVALEKVASQLGLEYRKEKPDVVGLLDGFEVTIDRYSSVASQDWLTRVVVNSLGNIPKNLEIKPEGLATQLSKTVGLNAVETGDADYDYLIRTKGKLVDTISRLDSETRNRAVEFLATSGRVAEGELRWIGTSLVCEPKQLATIVHRMLLLAIGLSGPQDESTMVERLVRNITVDPVPEVRLRNLKLLFQRFPDHPAAKETANIGKRDLHKSVRLLARAFLEQAHDGRLSFPESEGEKGGLSLHKKGGALSITRPE